MRYLKLTIILVLLSASAMAQTDSVLTLQQCVDLAIKNNLDVRRSELQMERDRVYWNQARENLLPFISGNVDHTIYNGRSQTADLTYVNSQITNANYNLSGSLILFNGLNLINSIKQNSLAYQAGKLNYQQAKENITLNVITTYLQVLSNEDQLTQAKNQLEVSAKQVERLDILNKDGAITPSQLYDLKGQSANDKLAIINAQAAIYASKLNLLQIMNVPFDKSVKLTRLNAEQLQGQYTATSADVYNKALSDLPMVKAADLRVKSAEKGLQATRGALLPTLSLNSGLSTQYSSGSKGTYTEQFRNNYNTGFGLGLSIPIINRMRQRNNVALAKINLAEAKYVDENTRIQLKQSVEQAYVNMTAAQERYQALREQVDAYAESFRASEVRFNQGALTSVDYLVAKGNMDRARTGLISARYDYFIRTKILDYYRGQLSL
jgi:outer membrane protein